MPSKRKHGKTSRTHIFQRSTRATRSRTRSCSQPKVKAATETDVPEELELSELPVENGTEQTDYNREEENDENHMDVEPEEQSTDLLNDSSEGSTFEKQDDRCEKITQNISLAYKNRKSFEPVVSSEDVIENSPSIPVLNRSRNRARSPRRAHRYKSYSHEMLVAAYKCVKDLKMPVKAAARMFGVPSSTLHNRVQGQVQIDDSILTSDDITKIIKRIKNGEGLDEAFADLTYEKSSGSLGQECVIPSVEEDINDDNITESIMEKMIAAGEENTPIKEEVVDPEYEYQLDGSMQDDEDNTSLHNISDEIYRNQQQRRRSYKRNYKTYSYEQLVAAYLYVKEKKVAVKFAARAFGVPPSTLNDRVQGKVYIDTSIVMNRPGARNILPKPNLHMETKLVNRVRISLY
ncbi:mblk-1-related factor 1-like [Mytilus edulis]|uniref:mblk-1-related factor 1-like n=1 Tax=Mytilus edulis TaxID=6550 RepID=UPI0039EE1B67